jgi:hypothetical protein
MTPELPLCALLLALTCAAPDTQAPSAPAPVQAVPGPDTAVEPATQRARMVELIRIETLLTAAETGVDTIDDRVLTAMGEVPRHEFVPPPLADHA